MSVVTEFTRSKSGVSYDNKVQALSKLGIKYYSPYKRERNRLSYFVQFRRSDWALLVFLINYEGFFKF